MSANRSTLRRPEYQRVADELMRRIAAGKYAVGSNLPTEMELSRHYGISRHTVREALRKLGDAGMIARRRGLGTEVLARNPGAEYRQSTNSINDLLQYAEESRITVLETRKVSCGPRLADKLACEPGDAWLQIRSLRTAPEDVHPICLTTAYVNADLEEIDYHLQRLTGPISAMLERVYGMHIGRIEQSIQAVRLTKRDAALLHAEEDSPALRATRRYYDDHGVLIELSNAVHPGERFTYVTTLIRSS
jgi:DNA-binding GntR family transcriptional regulator